MGTCIPACRSRLEGDDDAFSGSGRSDALEFCEQDMDDAEVEIPGVANRTANLEHLFEKHNCSTQPTCQDLVNQGLDVSLAQYQLGLTAGSSAGASSPLLAMVAALLGVCMLML